MKRHFVLLISLAGFIWFWLSILASTTMAHGGGEIQVAGMLAGPYKITVWTYPQQAQATRPLHVTVAVAQATDDSPVLDAAVVVHVVTLENNRPVLSIDATTEESANKLLYEADFTLPDTGMYQINVQVSGKEGQGETSFALQLHPPTNRNWFFTGAAILGIAVMMIGFYKSWSRQAPVGQKASAPKLR